ncbi:unnamed protein product [Angiostrongylus costaricensis]|uniref:Apple domain-containing protein n=1 Tax=Angiostrongylus costaricensis TaxID=334426 RepID=A0A0R3Q0R2_ANGCS|nr:unnamed protein product [Angiostrongylus costaricensis]
MKWLLMTVLLCFLSRCQSVICPSDMGALFLSNNLIGDNYELGSYCYDHCASSNCTGVLVNRNWCLSMNIDEFYGHIGNNNIIFRKEFSCNSITFFAQTRGCFLNTANSSTAKVLDNAETDIHVVYMEHQRLKKLRREQCSNSFHTIPWNQVALRGEAILVNVTGSFDNCLALCSSGCDYAAYSEYFSECFLITYDPNGQAFDFISDDFQVFENICNHPLERCSAKSAMYISYSGETSAIRNKCLKKCIADLHCNFAHIQNGLCVTAMKPRKLPRVIEKHCHSGDEAGVAVLFQEDPKCPANENGMTIEGAKLTDCLQLCVTHPTKSCEAVNFYKNGRCRLLNEVTPADTATLETDSGCRHFNLNVITFKRDGVRSTASKTNKRRKSKRMKLQAADKKDQVEIRKKPFLDRGVDFELKTICHYDSIIVKVTRLTISR